MALLRRVSSLKRHHNTYTVSRRPEPDNAERPKGMIRCHTTLLDDSVFTCDIDKHCFADALLDEILSHLDILERDYFGLAYHDEDVTKWLDPSKLLKKQFKGANTIHVNFRVKFYVTDPARLHEELTRYQFYLQIKKDLYTTRLPASFESTALLGAYIMQAELGDYDRLKYPSGYVSKFNIIPKQSVDFDDRVSQLHRSFAGKTTAEAESLFLDYARRLGFYGVELFKAKDHHGVDLGLGITCIGISVFKGQTFITTFSWLHIQKITYKRKRFYIELRPELGDQLSTVGFYMSTYDNCKQIWKNCIEYHNFFRLSGTESSVPMRSNSMRRKSRAKSYTGRTEIQALEANRTAALQRSKSVRVVRRPSQIFQRSSKSRSPIVGSASDTNDSPCHSSSSVRRSHSLGKDATKPKAHLHHSYREPSRERELDDLYSSEVSISDDMTGQFSLVPFSQDLPAKFRRISSGTMKIENGPTEYYDERNAIEERLGQVSMDDLASEGLLLIRIKPDEHGRYGFIVKGGADENLPVIVTKIAPDSAASLCNPPVEEGDQVIYINGKSLGDKEHDEIVSLIKSSSELVMIIKPRNLQRVNPSLRPSLPKINDPGQVLRDSLTSLKESFTSGKGILYFDRLYRKKPGLASIASKLPQNLGKNRYRDISAYDESRVHLNEGPDYINANFVNIEMYSTDQINKYIATQGPMQHTCKDFWQMIWEQGSTLIVMLTDVIEAGKVRCCKYWPKENGTQEYGKYEVTTLSEQSDRIYFTRQLQLRNRMSGESRHLVLMQYIDWPDHGVPGSKADFLRFVQGVRSLREGSSTPVIIHCSAGVGRTGMFILMETVLCKMEVLEPIYPLEIVRYMRDQRGMLVQTPIQYQHICESILKAYEDDYVEIELPTPAGSTVFT